MSAKYNPIPAQFTDEDLAFLLAFEANEQDEKLTSTRDALYFGAATTEDAFLQEKALGLATKLEKIAAHSQARLNRRYMALQIVH